MSESIYNLIPVEPESKPVKQIHRSTHNPGAKVAGSTFGCHGSTRLPGAGYMAMKEGSTFGPPSANGLKTIRTITNNARSPSPDRSHRETRKGPVPSKDDKPIIGIRTSKNFVVANAVEAILQVPKKVENLNLDYGKKEDYGKVPAYLTKVKEEIRRENEMITRYVREQMGEFEGHQEEFEEMPEAEREDLLDQLKKKWESVNVKYQRITHLVQLDTTGQVRRKEQLEGELTRLENDIQTLSRPGPVMIRKQ